MNKKIRNGDIIKIKGPGTLGGRALSEGGTFFAAYHDAVGEISVKVLSHSRDSGNYKVVDSDNHKGYIRASDIINQ